jgi:ribose/xylose/arabinose/galactoside ABC-type transport system permease subunit
VLSVVSNVMNLAGVSAFWQSAVKGVIVLGAVMVAAIVALRPLEILRLLRERARGGRV